MKMNLTNVSDKVRMLFEELEGKDDLNKLKFLIYIFGLLNNNQINDKNEANPDLIEDEEMEIFTLESVGLSANACTILLEYFVMLYNGLTNSKEAYEDAMTHKIKVAKNVKINHDDITSALSEGYPVTISLKIFDSFGNQSKGFVYRPTDEEITENKYGNHAMVICGYSEEDKVYIVRNSWGKGFGDNGYCYIPFSYIEDSNLTNSACVIISINEGEEVKGAGQQTAVSFNKTDMEIRYSIIRILVDEEKQLLNKNKIIYENRKMDGCSQYG